MKFAASSLLALMAFVTSVPAFAEIAMIIGNADSACRSLAERNGVKLSNTDWLKTCKQLAATHDDCVRQTGWAPGAKATDATTACYNKFLNDVRAIPKP